MTRFSLFYFFCCLEFSIIIASIGAQQTDAQNDGFNPIQILNDALLLRVEISVNSLDTDETLWDAKVNKITIPGRSVTFTVEGNNARLDIILTIYPAENEKMILAARSETWFGNEYNSTVTTFPLQLRDEVYYYPLGRADGGSAVDPLEIFVKVMAVPYLETLDNESRAELEFSLDASAQFKLTGD